MKLAITVAQLRRALADIDDDTLDVEGETEFSFAPVIGVEVRQMA